MFEKIDERKTDFGNRAAGFRTLEAGPDEIFQTGRRHPDVEIVTDIANVIKDKLTPMRSFNII
jgi:hypothetical protein